VEHLWKHAAKHCLEEHSFFKDCRHLLQDTIPLSQAKGMVENSYRQFFLIKIYPLLQYLRLYQDAWKTKTGTEWDTKLDDELCLNGYFIVAKKQPRRSSFFGFFGGQNLQVSTDCKVKYGAIIRKQKLFVGQLDCSLFAGLLTGSGLLPTTGTLYFLLASSNMNVNGGKIIYSEDTKELNQTIEINDEDRVFYYRRVVTGVYEKLTPAQNAKTIDYEIEGMVSSAANKLFPKHCMNDYFFGHKSTSSQGCNEVEENQFLMLQTNIYGMAYLDGVENYFILPRSQLQQEPKNFEPGNFSLYANC